MESPTSPVGGSICHREVLDAVVTTTPFVGGGGLIPHNESWGGGEGHRRADGSCSPGIITPRVS